MFFQRLLFLTLEDTPDVSSTVYEGNSFFVGVWRSLGYLPTVCGQNQCFYHPKFPTFLSDVRMVVLGSTIDLRKRNRCWSCGRRNLVRKQPMRCFFAPVSWNRVVVFFLKELVLMFFLIGLDVSYWNCSSLLMMCIYPLRVSWRRYGFCSFHYERGCC